MTSRCSSVTSAVFIVMEVVLASASILGQDNAPVPAQETTIQMTARKYRFDPPVVTVKQGDTVKLIITAVDHDHGFRLAAYGIDRKLPRGVATTVEFIADKAGTFPFQCSNFCGLGHSKMKGKLVVEGASGPASPPSSNL
jgi:cytochrome c oxidase subunit II